MIKKCILLTLFCLWFVTTSLFAQTNYEMIVEQTDGNKYYFELSEIKEVYFAIKVDTDDTSIEAMFAYLTSEKLGGRYSGSEGIKKAERYICNLIGISDSLTRISFPTDKCDMTNIIFHVQGETDSLIVIGAHYDAFGYVFQAAFPGADDNLSGVAVVLQLIKAIQRNKMHPHYSIDLCLWDGEEIGRYGSKYYLSKQSGPIKLYINIDTCGNSEFGLAYAYSDYTPNIVNEFAKMQEKLNMKVEEYHPTNYASDCDPFRDMNIPFISITDDIVIPPYIHSWEDNISIISFSRINNISMALYERLLYF